MNVELQYSIEFPAMIYMPDDLAWSLMPNFYDISLSLLTGTNNKKQINVAMERLKVFLASELSHSVFINQIHKEHAEMFEALGANVTTVPEDPVDQIIGIMLYCKLNAIMEDRMKIVQLDISSALGDSVWYKHQEEDNLGPFATDGWWHKNTVQHNSFDNQEHKDNVVNIERSAWLDYGLGWADDNDTAKTNRNVVYANFAKHDNK